MSRINLIGSNHVTNHTCHFGSMAGLAPTATVRPHITGLPGYKALKVAANGQNKDGKISTTAKNAFVKGCGLGRGDPCVNGKNCLKHLGYADVMFYYQTGGQNRVTG